MATYIKREQRSIRDQGFQKYAFWSLEGSELQNAKMIRTIKEEIFYHLHSFTFLGHFSIYLTLFAAFNV